jgi:hypothetical protein
MSKITNKQKSENQVLTPNTTQPNGGEPQIESNCREFFVDGECPKWRFKNGACPFNIYPIKGYLYCCMKKEGIKGGLALQGDEHESSLSR